MTALGTFVLSTYIVTWALAIAIPFILLALVVLGLYVPAGCLVLLLAVCRVVPRTVSPSFRNFFAKHAHTTFKSFQLLFVGAPPNPATPTIVCVHPHGILCVGFMIIFGRREFSHLWFCVASALNILPLTRAYATLLGTPSSADKSTMLSHMRKKRSIALIPGGFEEATIHCRGIDRVFLANRKGFVKYALQHGYALMPTYVFGEVDTFSNAQGFWKIRLWLNQFGIPAVLPFGRLLCPILPRNDQGMLVVVGEALKLPSIPEPTTEQVDEWHKKYVAELQVLYSKHAPAFYGPNTDRKLEIW
eukprot:c18390_g1_i1.p1 GENE.c18390_g1_i1~~c18390_g1_i1.p1  ORF type:complete len:303 (+),score=52.64 c18390_g1_i1:49-957(+)